MPCTLLPRHNESTRRRLLLPEVAVSSKSHELNETQVMFTKIFSRMKLLLIFVSVTSAATLQDQAFEVTYETTPFIELVAKLLNKSKTEGKATSTPEPRRWKESVLQEKVSDEEQYQTLNPHRNVLMSDIEDYGRCLSEAGFGIEIPRDLIVVYPGQPELKLVCEPLCKRPTESPEPEWFFFNKYFSNTSLSPGNETRVEMMKNVIVGFGKTTLVLKELRVDLAGKYYCKYDDIIIHEYWIYAMDHRNINFSLTESNVITIPNTTIHHPDWGITVLYKIRYSNCVLRTYKETLIDDSSILNATWWTHKVMNGRWWQRIGRGIKNFFSQYPKDEYLTPPRRIMQGFPFMVVDSEHSLEIQANYFEVSTLDLFSGKEIPFIPDFMPSAFPPELFNQTYIYESNCTVGSLIQRSYKEKTFYVQSKKSVKISCFGMREIDILNWTKDGVNLFSSRTLTVTNNMVNIHKASPSDAGKYTCWRGDSPIASTNLMVQSLLSLEWVKRALKWALSVLITTCLVSLSLVMIYYGLNSIIMFRNYYVLYL